MLDFFSTAVPPPPEEDAPANYFNLGPSSSPAVMNFQGLPPPPGVTMPPPPGMHHCILSPTALFIFKQFFILLNFSGLIRFRSSYVPRHGSYGPTNAPSNGHEAPRTGPLPFPGSSADGCPCKSPRRPIDGRTATSLFSVNRRTQCDDVTAGIFESCLSVGWNVMDKQNSIF